MVTNYSTEFFETIRNKFRSLIISPSSLQENWLTNEKSGATAKVTKGIYKGKKVAIKKIKMTKESVKSIMKNKIEFQNTITELSILTKVNSDNIPKLEGIYIKEDKLELYFILQFLEGLTLKEHFAPTTKTEWNYNQKIMIAYRLCKILAYIRNMGVIHRDVKPENIMIENESNLEPFLIDFGFSKIRQSDKAFTFTSTKCTPLYSPPENIMPEDSYAEQIGSTLDSLTKMSDENYGLAKINHKVDVWSFGCVLYELYTGKMPLTHLFNNMKEVQVRDLYNKISNNVKIYSEEDEKAYPEIIYIVDNCTKKNVNDRWGIEVALSHIEKIVQSKRELIEEAEDNYIYKGEAIKIQNEDNVTSYFYDGLGKLITDEDCEELKREYSGNYEYGNKSGFGVEQSLDMFYQGFWRNHKRHGLGYFNSIDGDQQTFYIGSFVKDKKDGYGYFLSEEECSLGLFSKDVLVEGYKYDKIDSKVYKGNFEEDLFVFGTVIDLNTGELYCGQYLEKKRNGYGYTMKDGEIKEKGLWNKNKLVTKC